MRGAAAVVLGLLACAVSGGPQTRSPLSTPRPDLARGRSARLLGLLAPPPPPPPPPAPFLPTPGLTAFGMPAFDAGGSQAVYDYSNIRNDMTFYSRTLDMVFKLLVALFALLLVPVLVPVLVYLAAPWLLEMLTDALAET